MPNAYIQYHPGRNNKILAIHDTPDWGTDGERAQNKSLEIKDATVAQAWQRLRQKAPTITKDETHVRGLPYRVKDEKATTVADACEAIAAVDIVNPKTGKTVIEEKVAP